MLVVAALSMNREKHVSLRFSLEKLGDMQFKIPKCPLPRKTVSKVFLTMPDPLGQIAIVRVSVCPSGVCSVSTTFDDAENYVVRIYTRDFEIEWTV